MTKDSKKLTARQEEARQRRAVLSSISRKARVLRDNRPELAEMTINQILMRTVYNPSGELEFKKFREWKAEGYTIKKGEKGFMLWAQPLSELKKQQGDTPEAEAEPDEDENSFFPVCYLFSNEQVIKPEPKAHTQAKPQADKVPDLVF